MGKFILIACSFIVTSLATAEVSYEKGDKAFNEGNYSVAIEEYTALANKGEGPAIYNLGRMYNNGTGFKQDFKKALELYLISAKKDYLPAFNNIGLMYSAGQGVEQSHKESIKWYRYAAEKGFSDSAVNIGIKFINGSGVDRDYATALMWFDIALELDYFSSDRIESKAKSAREKLVGFMKKSQIDKAKKLFRKCLDNNYKNCWFN